jgi:NAD(P)-dependent dehydrogenase (short-subunit alcohol dehydrogenase family)
MLGTPARAVLAQVTPCEDHPVSPPLDAVPTRSVTGLGATAGGEANTPLKRLGEPADMVGTAVFLASGASALMTGQVLFVDGGLSCGLFWPIDFDNQ